MSTDLFDQTEDEVFETESPQTDQAKWEDYVGEGKKYRDHDAVAKALAEKDAFIEQLKREQAEAREVIKERISMEQFLAEVKGSKPTPTSPSEPVTTPVVRDEQVSAVTPEAIEKIIAEREAKQKREANLKQVEAGLQAAFGRNWKQEVQKKAAELEVSTTYLTDVAARSPKAFFKAIGADAAPPAETFTPPPRGSVTSVPVTSSSKDYSYYQKQRREKGEVWYFSPQTRQEIWNELKAQGEEKFYKR